jgi:hypothetical protein
VKPKRWDLIRALDSRAYTVEAVTSTKAVGRGAKNNRREFELDRLEAVARGVWNETQEAQA